MGFSDREEGGGSPSGMMTMMTVTTAAFIEHLLFSRQSSKHFTCFNLLCPLKKRPPDKMEFIVFLLFPLKCKVDEAERGYPTSQGHAVSNGDAQEPGVSSLVRPGSVCTDSRDRTAQGLVRALP